MKLHLKKTDLKYGVTTLVLIALVCASIVFNGSNESYKTAAKKIDGETLFAGIFFGNKELGTIVPELNLPDSILQNSVRKKFIAEAVSNAKFKDAAFFAQFKKGIESGDPSEVNASILKASAIISQTVDKLKKERKQSVKFDLAGAVVDIAFVLPSGIVVYPGPQTATALIYNTDIATFAAVINDSGANSLSSHTLNREKYISFLTNTFNTN